jgi:hypothetical protein
MKLKDYIGFNEKIESTKKDTMFIPKIRYGKLYEKQQIMDIVPGFPINKKIKYDRSKMVQAIKNGMVILILFQGSTGSSKDKWKGGRERVIYPMVLGVNKNTKNELVRGWHLEGYSISQKKETKKVWRLFKTSGIKSMIFTGHFYRLPPKGYKMNDRIMTERTIARADFSTIRRNQEALIKSGKIEKEEEVKVQTQSPGVTIKLSIKNTGTILDIKNPWENEYLKDSKKFPNNVKITILKTIFSNEYIAILGALGEPGKTVKIYEEKKLLGSYKTIESFTGNELKNKTNVKNIIEFELFTFIKKL